METKAAFVRANGVIELYAITQIRLDFAFIIHPCYTESKDTIGFNQALNDLGLFELRMLIIHILNRDKDFSNSLQILKFSWMLGLEISHDFFNIHSGFSLKFKI